MGISHSITILFALLVLLAVFMALRGMGVLPGMELVAAKASSAKGSNKVSRRAEALILLMAAMAIFAFTATNTSTGGRLLTLDQYRLGFALTNVVVAVVIGLVILLGAFAVLKGLTSAGVIVVIVALCSYGMLLNGPELLMESLAPEGSTVPASTLSFVMYGTDTKDAELWVNDVRLGTLPYETTFDEFYEKVPYWAEEPNEMKRENRDAWLLVKDHRVPGGRSGSFENRWARIRLPKEPVHWDERDSTPHKSEEERTYYVRVKLGGEWGYATGGSGSSGGGGGRYDRRSANVHFGFTFLERQKRIEKLLDVARAYDYEPGGDWFEAIETYNSDGWIAVRQAMDTEPEILKLLDAWARWRYDLDEVSDEKSAWAKFEQTCDDVDQRQYYRSSDVAGRAVELLAAKLGPERLVERAGRLLRRTGMLSWLTWKMNGRVQFGYTNLPEGIKTGATGRHSWRGIGGGRRTLPIRAYAVAHAVWRLHELLHAEDPNGVNIVQEKVVTEAIRWHPHNMGLRHREDVEDGLSLLFGDLEAGSGSLACEYWPRFAEYARTGSRIHESLQIQWEYLLEMEPVSTVDMYLEAWAASVTYTNAGFAIMMLERLPDEKRHAVARALLDYVETNGAPGAERQRDDVVGRIKPYVEAGDKEQRLVREILEDIKGEEKRYTREHVREWLTEGKPGHPLVGVLASQSDPELRVLVMGAVVSHPTPGNREILGRLLDDPDDDVREAAEEARAKVEELKNMPPAELAHMGRR